MNKKIFKKNPTPSNAELSKFLKTTILEAGKLVAKNFGRVVVSHTKTNASDFVTKTDLAANKLIVNRIKARFPTHGIISEEEPASLSDAEYVWIIDPIDGTRNFVNHLPLFGVMIALARHNVIQMAAIYNPVSQELFFAFKNHGTFLNGKAVHCTRTKDLDHSWGCIPVRLSKNNKKIMRQILAVNVTHAMWTSGTGSVAMNGAYIATGGRDWLISRGAKIWDYAAPSLIMSEAGCTVTNIKGKPWSLTDTEILAANPVLHKQLLKIFAK